MSRSFSNPELVQDKPMLTPIQGAAAQLIGTPILTAIFTTFGIRSTTKAQIGTVTPLVYAFRTYGYKLGSGFGKNIPLVANQQGKRDDKMIYEESFESFSESRLGRAPTAIMAFLMGFVFTHPASTLAGFSSANKEVSDKFKEMSFWKRFPKAYMVAPGLSMIGEISNVVAYIGAVEMTEKLKQIFPTPVAYALSFPPSILAQALVGTINSSVANRIYFETKVTASEQVISPGSWGTFNNLMKTQGLYNMATIGFKHVALRVTIIYPTVEGCRLLTERLTTRSWSNFFKPSKEATPVLQSQTKDQAKAYTPSK